jgi:hypothetical protein
MKIYSTNNKKLNLCLNIETKHKCFLLPENLILNVTSRTYVYAYLIFDKKKLIMAQY